MRLSLAMIVKNEEEKLARCLESVRGVVDEMVIVDTGSQDKTREIAESFGAKVSDFTWCDDFAKARNASIERTTGDLVLVFDADFVLQEFPKELVLKALANKKFVALADVVNSFIDDNGERAQYHSTFCAVIPREARFLGAIHEQVDLDYPRVRLPIVILHDGYENRDRAKAARNIGILERELKGDSASPHAVYLMYKLAQEYNGQNELERAGSLYARAYARVEKERPYFPSFLVDYLNNCIKRERYLEGLELIQAEQGRFADYPDFHFACGELYMNLVLSNPGDYIAYFNQIPASYERALAIGENPKYLGGSGKGSFMSLHNLGAFHEVTGNRAKALEYYRAAAQMGYAPSQRRVGALTGGK